MPPSADPRWVKRTQKWSGGITWRELRFSTQGEGPVMIPPHREDGSVLAETWLQGFFFFLIYLVSEFCSCWYRLRSSLVLVSPGAARSCLRFSGNLFFFFPLSLSHRTYAFLMLLHHTDSIVTSYIHILSGPIAVLDFSSTFWPWTSTWVHETVVSCCTSPFPLETWGTWVDYNVKLCLQRLILTFFWKESYWERNVVWTCCGIICCFFLSLVTSVGENFRLVAPRAFGCSAMIVFIILFQGRFGFFTITQYLLLIMPF